MMRISTLSMLLPALMLAACGSGSDAGNTSTSAPVAPVKAPAGTNWVETVSKTPEGGFRMGSPDAPLKIVEYGSRACPYCALFDAEGFEPLKAEFVATGKASYEFREYPIHGPLDFAPILLGQCTGDTATFFPILDAMFKNQETLLKNEQVASAQVQAIPNPTPNQIAVAFAEGLGYIDFMKQRGLPEAKARACLNDKAGIDKIVAEAKFANDKFQVSGTPTFILNGVKLEGADRWDKLKAALIARGG